MNNPAPWPNDASTPFTPALFYHPFTLLHSISHHAQSHPIPQALNPSAQTKPSLTIKHDHLMRRVHIQAVVERERHRVVVQGRVRARVVRRDGRVREPRDELLDVADALHARDGGAEGGVVPGGEW